MHVNDPSFDYEPTCSRCEKRLTEDTISEFSMREGQCAECYEITVSDSPSMLQYHIDEIRQQLKQLDSRIYSAADHLLVIETYLKKNCYESK